MGDKENPPHEPRVIVQTVQDAPFPTGIILDDANYPLWSQLMEMRIGARNKSGFITGATPKPSADDKQLESWLIDNNRVKSWLIDSMSPSLIRRFIRLQTAKEIWEAVAKTFYDGSDETQLFELNRRSFTTRQNGRSLPTYYNELVSIFQEIDTRLMAQEKNVNQVISLHKTIARLRVHIFLAGLDVEFNQTRSEILRKDPPLDLESCYAYVRKDQNQRNTMEEPKAAADSIVHLATRNRLQKGKSSNNKGGGGSFICAHCGEEGHSKQRCYEIIGYPEWWDFSKKPRRKPSQATVAVSTNEEPTTSIAAHTKTLDNSGMSSTNHAENNTWINDTGATDHMTNDPSKLVSKCPPKQSKILTANGGGAHVTCEGPAQVSSSMNLDTVLVVPSLSSNLLSVSQITKALKCSVTFWPDECMFQDMRTHRILGYGTRRGKLYYLEEEDLGKAYHTGINQGNKVLAWLWHRRLGHLSFSYLKRLKPSLFLNLNDSEFKCGTCEMAKSHKTSYTSSNNKSLIPFMTIHSDVWGPARILTPNGARYFVTFIDECTRMIWISLLKHKGEVCYVFQELYRMVKSQYKCDIQVLQSDNGTEYINREMENFCKENSIRHQTSCVGTPQQNGLAERRNRQLLEIVRASLFDMNVPRQYWGEAVRSAAYLMNRTPSSVIEFKTPIARLHGLINAPTSVNLEPRVFGCTSYVHQNIGKLEPRAIRYVFLGYADLKKGEKLTNSEEENMHRKDQSSETRNDFVSETEIHGTTDEQEDNAEEPEFEVGGDDNMEQEGREDSKNTTGPHEAQDSTTSPTFTTIENPQEPAPVTAPVTTPVNTTFTASNSVLQESVDTSTETRYPTRQNRGIPKKQYQPDLDARAKYPMSNYLSSHRLAKSHLTW
ncbi:hypothetical protein OSB04_016277 [Centaurea solstitialis]|uniref:Gag-pol polyprotein n=1 Tax=Centaurea solstitialis TaxID=347529 RepID=A0AA38W8B3_9ASTR|nr:hypothetical protein OSB04_016277 [Centaurea solstitialis]